MSVVQAVMRELERVPDELAESVLAATALALAEEIDGGNSATSKSMCAKELRETMAVLRSLAPAREEKDELSDLRAKRETRLARGAAASDSARP